jgi:hypothetical protein
MDLGNHLLEFFSGHSIQLEVKVPFLSLKGTTIATSGFWTAAFSMLLTMA